MNEQGQHIVSGIYTTRAEAAGVRERLVARGFPHERIHVVGSKQTDDSPEMSKDNQVLQGVLVDGAVGATVGTVIGGLGEVALIAANVTLFVSSPLIAPLFMLGWGAFIGGLLGAATGAEKAEERKEGRFSELVIDAIRSGHAVLIAHTRTTEETALARDLIGDSVVLRS